MTPTITIDISVGSTGAISTPPATIWQNMVTYLQATNPGYTILPALLIEDMLSTAVAGVVLCDQAAVESINSLTPFTANPWLLIQLGNCYGVSQGQSTNTSVYVTFYGIAGTLIPEGFIVTDGTYQYVVQDGGSIPSDNISAPLYCIATVPGSWGVPIGSVNALVSSNPGGLITGCANASPGTPSAGPQTTAGYQAQVLQAGLASAQGMQRFLKTQLALVPGVQPRLISVRPANGGWEIIVGGGDPYQVAGAIYLGMSDISVAVGSILAIANITQASPAQVTTALNHGLTTGEADIGIAGVVGMTAVNGSPYTITVVDEKNFTLNGVNSTGFGAYVSGGVVTPNHKNITVDIVDYPDSYAITFVNPPAQVVSITLTWNTNSPNFVSSTAIAQLAAPAIAAYVNSVGVGQPINIFELNMVFQGAVASLISSNYLDRMVWTIDINGIATAPASGTGAVSGDPESYFTCAPSAVTVTQG